MKVGILTFQNTVNYGAKFQEYALQRYINNLGINCEVINYINDDVEKKERPLKLYKQRNLKGITKYILLHKHQIKKWKNFEKFTLENIKRSNCSYDKKNIIKLNEEYDKFIVGSDQVWNTEITKSDYTYYLDFVKNNKNKYSYAASFGYSKIPKQEFEKIKTFLNEFNMLNVREEKAVELIRETVNREVTRVVDPTFLIEKKEWMKFVNKENIVEDYIFVYMPDFRDEVFKFIRKLANDKKCKIIFLNDSIRKFPDMTVIHDASPEEFLTLLNNAKYVVTGSFHCISMSIIFQKNFYYMLNDNNRNSRIIDLIKLAKLENRNLDEIKNIDIAENNSINYSVVNENIEKTIEESKKIISEIIKEC